MQGMDNRPESWIAFEFPVDGIAYEYQYKARPDGYVARWICRGCSQGETYRPLETLLGAFEQVRTGLVRHHAQQQAKPNPDC